MQARDSVYIIAEAGVNHDGSLSRALELVDIAIEAKADAVKFQLFEPATLTTATAKTADYQAVNLNDNAVSQQAMLAKLMLKHADYVTIANYCAKREIDFLCTPFDKASLEFLVRETKMRWLKLASGEVTHGPLLEAAAASGLPVILSTGMADLAEIKEALGFLKSAKDIVLLHCVSQYPAPPDAMNLRAMATMREAFGLPVGLSDHSLGLTQSIAAVALGAVMLEKHFTHEVTASGPDHAASLSPQDLHSYVQAIREVEQGLGDGVKCCQPIEENTREVARRTIVANVNIKAGDVFSEANLICKRPMQDGVRPNDCRSLLGRCAKHDYKKDQAISPDELA